MEIEKEFKKTINLMNIPKKKKIIVALSGGKDSTTTAFLLKKLGYNIEGFHIDLKIGNYSDKCLNAVKELCEQLKIKLYLYDIKNEMGGSMCYLRTSVQEKSKGRIKNCAICGVIKKWVINKKARELKAEYIATGHHLDDESETFLMNILKGALYLSINSGFITKNISNKKFIPRIKPLFYVSEKEIKKYSKKNKLPVIYEKCPCALDSYRIQIRKWIQKNLDEKEKRNLIKNMESFQKRFNQNRDTKFFYCENCGEPSRNNLCKKCILFSNYN